jgi:NAD(P)-dependent dehydrogenase (short-subunit alcohol dehydrogenase family)
MYNPFSLIGKTILVTGASSGIGRAIAIESSKMGANIILTGRNEERLQETMSMLDAGEHQYMVADITNEEDMANLVEQLPTLTGCVHSAGIIGLTPIQAITTTKINQFEQINLHAPILLTKQLLKRKKLAKNSSVVFVSSAAGVYRVSTANALYAVTKSGLDAFMRSAALELASKNIRFNSVNPAMIETEALSNIPISEEQKNANLAQYPIKRYGKPEEVAYATIYLLSDASTWITGTEIKLDGGLTLS